MNQEELLATRVFHDLAETLHRHSRPFSKDPYELDLDFVESTYFWGNLGDFVASCRSRDIDVYIAWPPVVNGRLDFNSPGVSHSLRENTGRINELGVSVLGNPSEFQYDPELFTDNIYHLTGQGRAEHTSRLLGALRQEPAVFARQAQ